MKSLDRKAKEYSISMLQKQEEIMQISPQDVVQDRPGQPVDIDSQNPIHESTEPTVSASVDAEPYNPLTNSPGSNKSEESTMKLLLSRAANLIREAFEVDGGSVFYDGRCIFLFLSPCLCRAELDCTRLA